MNQNDAILAEHVCKRYPVFTRPWQGVRYLWRIVRHGAPDAGDLAGAVEALTDVSLRIGRGERVGIVGRNGAGKSTLLKLLGGAFPPVSGSLRVNGEIYCLLPGSVSFSLEQSTLENAFQHLAYLPLSAQEMRERLDDIREFTELGEYFTQPVKNLSLGMRVRAEFAVATARSADIVIVDEVLGAGDIYWSEKIARRMEQMCARGATLLLVSHSLAQINRFCERAIWIERGRVVMDGPAAEVTKRYEGFLERLSWQTDDPADKTVTIERVTADLGNEILPDSGQTVTRWPGRGDVRITGVWINGRATSSLSLAHGEALSFRLALRAARVGTYRLRYLFTLWSLNGKRLAALENEADQLVIGAGQLHEVCVRSLEPILVSGRFLLSVTISDVGAGLSAAHELSARLDVIYKSFLIEVEPSGSARADAATYPVYRIVLQAS